MAHLAKEGLFMINDICQSIFLVGRESQYGFSLLGTSFLIKEGVFVTAYHVVGAEDNNLVIVLNDVNSIQEYQDSSTTQRRIVSVKILAVDPIHDVCLLKADKKVLSSIQLGSLDDVFVGQNVEIFGFPHCNHNRMILTMQETIVGAKILLNNNGIRIKNAVLNIQARPGQSGSPIFHNNIVVGMLLGSYAPKSHGSISIGGIDPQTLHQTTHAVSAEYIGDMLK